LEDTCTPERTWWLSASITVPLTVAVLAFAGEVPAGYSDGENVSV
jgi:hypothetical protein